MCFLSAGPRWSQSYSAKGRKRDWKLQKFEQWRLKMSQRDSVFFCFLFFWLPSCFPRWVCRIFWFISSRVGPVEVTWVTSSPWGRAGGDSIGAKFPLCSSLKFPFEDEGYSEAFPAKNKPSNQARVWRGGEQMWKVVLRFATCQDPPNVTHCTLNYSDKCCLFSKVRGQSWWWGQRCSLLASVSHINTSAGSWHQVKKS